MEILDPLRDTLWTATYSLGTGPAPPGSTGLPALWPPRVHSWLLACTSAHSVLPARGVHGAEVAKDVALGKTKRIPSRLLVLLSGNPFSLLILLLKCSRLLSWL